MGNPSSLHNLGSTATRLLEASRRQIAELLHVRLEEIFFTSGGTEGEDLEFYDGGAYINEDQEDSDDEGEE